MASGSNEYEVMIRSVETVVPTVLVQKHRLPLSNFDLLQPPVPACYYFCFQRPTPTTVTEDASVGFITFLTMVAALKAALSKVLVIYYPLAGEIVTNSDGEPEILCNNSGVDLIEAYADVELRNLNLYNPDDSVEAKLLPKDTNDTLCIQVTELRCGAMVIGCVFDHRAADAYSFFMFMSAWANIALNKPINQMPSFCRFLLSSGNISSSNSSDPIYDQIFIPLSLQPPQNPEISSETRVNHIYYISAIDIARLQELSGHSHSKIVCFIAYFWKILARTARRGEKLCSMGAVVDGRSFMKTVHGDNFMKNYFGNVLSVPFGKLQAKTLIDMTLAEVAEEVNKWLSPAKKEDHFFGLLKWVEAHKPKPILPTTYVGDCKEEDEWISCAVSSGRRYPEINFGWGNAIFSSTHFPVGDKGGLLVPVPQSNTGDWVVYAQVAPRLVAAMEQEPTIFHPLRTLHEYNSKSSRARL
ncbi:hypothetical protein LUZ63_000520 [Rhynchospora breviuscula]|uniref:Uncharacterized protein n=1 Tax=Rhynchospora breviuscula TaxID=2022672 RepID=A0A9Q0CVC5_9POAL|nr:hypothetical protein LUZ63_000520 [Rhynchospora breviuscula]